MKKEYSQLLTIVNGAIRQKQPQIDSNIDWDQMQVLISYSGLSGVVLPVVGKLPEAFQPSKELMDAWRQATVGKLVRQARAQMELGRVFQNAKEQGIRLISFKGILLAALYTNPLLRFSTDADVYVDPAEKSRAETMFVQMGYTKLEECSKEHVPVYGIDCDGRYLKVELHDSLWEDYEGYQTELLDSLQLLDESSLIECSPCDIPIVTMGYENHLIFLVFHMAKHFAFEAIDLRFIIDIMLFIERYHEKVDWLHFWKLMGKLKYDKLLASILKICYEYFEFHIDILPKEFEKLQISDIFLEDILLRGTMRRVKNTEAYSFVGYIEAYFLRDRMHDSSKGILKIFPERSELKKKYAYAKKYPVLLPIAWGHRLFNTIHYSVICHRKGYAVKQVVEKAKYRLDLLAELGLLEKE